MPEQAFARPGAFGQLPDQHRPSFFRFSVLPVGLTFKLRAQLGRFDRRAEELDEARQTLRRAIATTEQVE